MDEQTKQVFENRLKEMKENEFEFSQGLTSVKEIKRINLVNLHDRYKERFHIEDTKRIDIILAVALSRNIKGESPIWLILVGPSGDMKSVQLNALKSYNTTYIHKITSKTLVNGFKNKEKFPDLAPQLDGKLIIIRDMAALLKLNPTEKGEIWGQLRDLYDGFAGASSGMGMDIRYENINTTLLAGSTPSIDGQILIHQDLGTRELIYRTEGNKDKRKAMRKCINNEEIEREITKELNEITLNFLGGREIKRDFIPEHYENEIMRIAEYLSLMRATAEIDSYEKSLRCNVIPEEPTRIVKQLKKLYVCLLSLDDTYLEERALNILWHIARSSASQIRIELIDFFLNHNTQEFSTSRLAELIKKGKGTVQTETAILWNLGILNLRKVETNYPDRFYDYWSLNPNYDISKLTCQNQNLHSQAQDRNDVEKTFPQENNSLCDNLDIDGRKERVQCWKGISLELNRGKNPDNPDNPDAIKGNDKNPVNPVNDVNPFLPIKEQKYKGDNVNPVNDVKVFGKPEFISKENGEES